MMDLLAFNRDVWVADFIGGALMCLGWLTVSVLWDGIVKRIKRG